MVDIQTYGDTLIWGIIWIRLEAKCSQITPGKGLKAFCPWAILRPIFPQQLSSAGLRWQHNTSTAQSGTVDIHTKQDSSYFQPFSLKPGVRWKACVWEEECLRKLTSAIPAPVLAHHLQNKIKWWGEEACLTTWDFKVTLPQAGVEWGWGGKGWRSGQRMAWLVWWGFGYCWRSSLRILHPL